MKLVFIENNRPVTDSLTVAETFGKDHRRVLQDVRELDCSEEFRQHHFVLSSYTTVQNKELPKYLITQDGFAFLVMGYTGKEAARFKEMYIGEFNRMREELNKPQLPQTYKEALIALVDQVEANERLVEVIGEKDKQIELQAPKVALYDTAMSANNNYTMERVSKTLGYGRNKLFAFLREMKILRSNNLPYQEYMDRGYFDVRQYSITHTTTGIENKSQTLVTPKGMAFIHKLLLKHGKIPETA